MAVLPGNEDHPRCLITGATGFIGSQLGRVLAERGWIVTALARPTSDQSGLDGLPIRWVFGDVSDPQSLRPAVQGQTVVFHCAGLTKAIDPDDLVRINSQGTRNVLEACGASDRPPSRIVTLSSQAAAGPALPDGTPRSEDDPCEPVSYYGRSKLEGERECRRWRDRLPVVVLRPVVVYGPRERDLYTIFKGLVRMPILMEAGPRPVTFQAIHAFDLAEAMIAAARAEDSRVAGRTFFVGHPSPWSSVEFGREIGRAVGRPRIRVIRVPWAAARFAARASEAWSRRRGKPGVLSLDKLREMAAGPWLCRVDAFQKATGWTFRFDAPEGLRATARWYRRHKWI